MGDDRGLHAWGMTGDSQASRAAAGIYSAAQPVAAAAAAGASGETEAHPEEICEHCMAQFIPFIVSKQSGRMTGETDAHPVYSNYPPRD